LVIRKGRLTTFKSGGDYIINLDQEIKIKWSTRNKNRYESLGYKFTGMGTNLNIKLSDLNLDSCIKVKVNCDGCGKEMVTPYRNYNRIVNTHDNYMCRKCNANYVSTIRISNNKERMTNDFREMCNQNGYESIANIDDYYGCEVGMPFICPTHGKQYLSINQLRFGCICPECGRDNKSISHKLSIDKVIKIIESKNNNKLLNPNEYVDINTKNLKVKCGRCGNIFVTSLASIKNSNGRCYSCGHQISDGEERIKNFLDAHNIKYIREKRFSDCKYKNTLPFDFYLPEIIYCIEFDGIQHYKVAHGNDEEYLKLVQKRDSIKTKYCEDNNIKLIRIPYWDFKNIETILTKELIEKCS